MVSDLYKSTNFYIAFINIIYKSLPIEVFYNLRYVDEETNIEKYMYESFYPLSII